MPTYTTFTLSNGATIQVESTLAVASPRDSGPIDASSVPDRAWKDSATLVAEIGAEVVGAMRQAFTDVDEVSVEFGANISGRSGVILVEGSVSANLKVVAKWKRHKQNINNA